MALRAQKVSGAFEKRAPGPNPARCHTLFGFVVGSRFAPRVFLPPQKPASPNSKSTRIEDLSKADVPSSQNILF